MGLQMHVKRILHKAGIMEGEWRWEGNKLKVDDRPTLFRVQDRLRESREFGPVYGNVLTLEIEIGEREEYYLSEEHDGLCFEEYAENFERGLYYRSDDSGGELKKRYYDAVEETSLDNFITKVNTMVNAGYTLYGSTVTYYDPETNLVVYFQALVRV